MRVKRKDIDLRIEDGILYFGDTPVRSDIHYDTLYYPFKQPRWGIRVARKTTHWITKEKYTVSEWVTGLDVMSDGKLWVGTIRMPHNPNIDEFKNFIPSSIHRNFKPIKFKLDNLCEDTMGKEWVIVEDPIYNDDQSIQYRDISDLVIE